jgi:hypothetical protein
MPRLTRAWLEMLRASIKRISNSRVRKDSTLIIMKLKKAGACDEEEVVFYWRRAPRLVLKKSETRGLL